LIKKKRTSLRFVVKLPNGETKYEQYDHFLVTNENKRYQMFVAEPTGPLGKNSRSYVAKQDKM
jgi:hypothetical protein